MPGHSSWGQATAGIRTAKLQNTYRNKDINNYKHYQCMVFSIPHRAVCHFLIFPVLNKAHRSQGLSSVTSEKSFSYMELIRPCDKEYTDWCATCHHKDMPLLQTGNWQFRVEKWQCQTLISQRSILLFWKSKWTLFPHFCTSHRNDTQTHRLLWFKGHLHSDLEKVNYLSVNKKNERSFSSKCWSLSTDGGVWVERQISMTLEALFWQLQLS